MPFIALTGFADPLSSFNLQFRESEKKQEFADIPENTTDFSRAKPRSVPMHGMKEKKAGEVIAIDKFRKKPK